MKEVKNKPNKTVEFIFDFCAYALLYGWPLHILVGCEKKLIKGKGGGGLEIFVI